MKKKIPKISIIMSVRNGERYLGDAINSILMQTYKDFEFIIVDDGSTDASPLILKRFTDKRIKILTNIIKKGLTKSLNIALNVSRGEYIARMDDDDIARKDRLERQINFLSSHKEIGVVGSWVRLVDKNGKEIGLLKFPCKNTAIIKKIFLYNPIRHSTVLFRKNLIKKYGKYDSDLDGAEDYDLWLRLAKKTKLANIALPLLSYRIHKDRVSEKEEKKVLRSALKARIKAILQYHYSKQNLIYLIIPIITYSIPGNIKRIIKRVIYLLGNSFRRITYFLTKEAIRFVQKTSSLSSLAIRLMKLTHKYNEAIHPKHLISTKDWFLSYLSKSDTVLDIGCNNGQNTLKAAKFCKKIIGFDNDPNFLEIAKREITRKRIKNVEILRFNAEEVLPFKNNSFDKVLFFAVLEHLTKRNKVMVEIKRILKSKGLLLLSVPNKDTKWKKLQKKFGLPYYSDSHHQVEYDKTSITQLLKKYHFKIISISPVSFDMPFVGIIDLLGGFSLNLYRYLSNLRKEFAFRYPKETVSFEIIAQNFK